MNTELQRLTLEAETSRIEAEQRDKAMSRAKDRDYLLITIIVASVLLASSTQGASIAWGCVALAVGGVGIDILHALIDKLKGV